MENSIIAGKTLIIFGAGIAWCIGHHLGWDPEVTGYIGWAFWLCIIFM